MLKLFDSRTFSGRSVQLVNSNSFIRSFNDKAESYEITGMLVNVCFHSYSCMRNLVVTSTIKMFAPHLPDCVIPTCNMPIATASFNFFHIVESYFIGNIYC